MRWFSEREGIVSVRDVLQTDDLNEDTRNRIWNALSQYFFANLKQGPFYRLPSEQKYTMKIFWDKFLKMRHDELEDLKRRNAYDKLQNYIFEKPWHRILDFIEAIIEYDTTGNSSAFSDRCNLIFEEENVGYRIIEGIVTKIISDEEIASVEKVIKCARARRIEDLEATAFQLEGEEEILLIAVPRPPR